MSEAFPLVSCIMPTCDRRRFVPTAISHFLRQDYPNKELMIVDDGTDPIADLLPADDRIRLTRLPRRSSVGAKRNLACEQTTGPLIAHWDDDDWHAPHRLSYQVEQIRDSEAAICGIKNLLFLDTRTGKAWQYNYPAGQRPWLSGNSLLYTRDFWAAHRFPEINIGEDSRFVWTASPQQLIALNNFAFHIGIIHDGNVSPKQIGGAWWRSYPVDEIRRLMGDDWHALGTQPNQTPVENLTITISDRQKIPHQSAEKTTSSAKNVFACLVHENPDCILDLVRNLRHLDPDSALLVYNGSRNPRLLDSLPLAMHGAVVHPTPRPMAWGKLHDFAVDCMRFGLERFDFQMMTIVDSDQLALRPGYSRHVGEYLLERPRVGMLGNSPTRQSAATVVPPARAAFAEIDLWRPLLARFENGEDKFVHWSFWPSTVYTAAAARELVEMFDTDVQLKQILSRSRIWATEEIILPTLTALLGYEIAANPCSYDFVKYRCPYSPTQIGVAMGRPDVFWAHPVQRQFEDSLRRQIRTRHGEYQTPLGALQLPAATSPAATDTIKSAGPTIPPLLLTRPILARMRPIEGWLDEDEADLLIAATVRSLADVPEANAVVEVGSYCGRATVVLASVVKAVRPAAKVWSIDPHDGKLGLPDRPTRVPPSFEKLQRNLQSAGVSEWVEVRRQRSTGFPTIGPIAFLLIDGLHDYASVRADFDQFAAELAPGGLVAFHDYADYFPGVRQCVDELVRSNDYLLRERIGTFALLKKPSAPLAAPLQTAPACASAPAHGSCVESDGLERTS